MKRKGTLTPLGETEVEVLQAVWDAGEATVADVHERLSRTRKLAYTTVMTTMKKLATKGYLTAEREERRDRYRPARSAEQVQGSLLSGLVGSVFGGSPVALVKSLVREEPLSDEEKDEIRRLLDEL